MSVSVSFDYSLCYSLFLSISESDDFRLKPPCILLGNDLWENIHTSFASPHTEEETADFQPLLIQLGMGIEKGDRFSTIA